MPRVTCLCGRLLSFRPEQAGRTVKCPACSAQVRLPILEPTALQRDQERENRDGRVETGGTGNETPQDPHAAEAAPPDELRLEAVPPSRSPTVAVPRAPAVSPTPPPRPSEAVPSFWNSLAGAFVFPLQGDGLVTLLAGLGFFTVAHYVTFFLGFFPLFGWLIAVVFYVVLTGYFAGYLMAIIERSARGEQDAPPWPDLMDYQENALKPFLLSLRSASSVSALLSLMSICRPSPAKRLILRFSWWACFTCRWPCFVLPWPPT